jgi:hypothetical protein
MEINNNNNNRNSNKQTFEKNPPQAPSFVNKMPIFKSAYYIIKRFYQKIGLIRVKIM